MKIDWPEVRLGEVLNEVSRPEEPQADIEYRLLGMRLYAGGLFVKQRTKGINIKASKIYRVENGDFIYNRLFAWKGSFGIACPDSDGAYVSNEFPCFVVDEEQVERNFLKWYMSRLSFWQEVESLSTGMSRQSRLRLKQERFLSISIPLPPLPEQRRIAAKLAKVVSRVKEARGLTEQVKEEQVALILSRVEEISRDAPRFPMAEVAPVVRRPVEIDPDSWYPELGIRSFGRGLFEKPRVQGSQWTWQRPYWMKAGDLLFSNIKAWEGAVAVISKDYDGYVGSHRYITCRVDHERVTPEFLCQWFLSHEGLALLGGCSPGATDRNRTLGLKKLETIEVPLPPIELQRDFSEIIRRIECVRAIHQQEAASLEALIPALLDQAFCGRL